MEINVQIPLNFYNSYPSPTSRDIITMNPMITPIEDSFPFPLQTMYSTITRSNLCYKTDHE